jgi:hypothetical protein
MAFINHTDENLYGAEFLNTITSWNPDDNEPVEGDWDDEDDEDFDDRVADLDDLHEIELEDEFGETDPDDDDHLPDDDDEDE